MNLFDNPIIAAYKNQKNTNILTEDVSSMLGSDDLLLDQLIEEAMEEKTVDYYGPVFEELTSNEAYQAQRWGSSGGTTFYRDRFISQHPEAEKAFAQHRYTEGAGRIRIPLGTLDNDVVKPHNDVIGHLKMHGYDVDHESYKNGLASKKIVVGNPEKGIPMQEKTVQKRIGAVLNEIGAPDHVKRAFEKDPFRAGAKTQEYDMILTHKPEDVYGMSTGRGWTSCAQMRRGENGYNGPAAKHMQEEIANHTHVAYLVPKGGDVDKDAMARVSFKKHHSIDGSHETLVDESNVYGTAPHGFLSAARREVGKLFPIRENLVYKKNSQVYSDNGRSFVFGSKPDSAILDKAWATTKGKDENERGEILQHITPGEKYKSTKLNQVSKLMKKAGEHADAGDFHNAYETLGSIHEHITSNEVRRMGYSRNDMPSTLSELKDKVAATFNPDNSSHIERLRQSMNHRYHNVGTVYGDIMQKAYSMTANRPIKNFDDVIRHVKVTAAAGYSAHESKMNFADKHDFGARPVIKVAKLLGEHGMLNKRTLEQAYFGAKNSRFGNIYDHSVKLAQDDVPGAHEIVDEQVKNFMDRGIKEENVARAFRYSKPETRKVLASKMGIDHNKLLRKYKAKFDADDAYIESLKKKAQESESVTP